jgi:hypothetical protein
MQATGSTLDRMIARILFVTPREQTAEQNTNPTQAAERVFSLSLMFSGVRCILMYVVLPFVLPLLGVAGDFAIQFDIAINLIAIGAIIYSLRRFWIVDYHRKWAYLVVAVVALAVLTSFIALDVQTLMGLRV